METLLQSNIRTSAVKIVTELADLNIEEVIDNTDDLRMLINRAKEVRRLLDLE